MWFRAIFRHKKSVASKWNSIRTYISPSLSKERLMLEYQRSRAFTFDTKLPADVNKLGIFANDELNLEDVDVYGYDYDYTLAAYKKTMVEKMIFNLAKKALVQEFHYPDGILHRTYDPQSTIRGLHYDIHKGLLIKLNSMLQIQPDAVYRGKIKLTEYEVAELYPTRRLTLEDIEALHTPYVQLVDNFAKPVMCLLGDVIQWFVENGVDYEPESIYSDVRACIDRAHPLFHLAAASDPKIILDQDPKLRPMLDRLKKHGKITFLMTNSPFEIVNAGMCYMFGDDWRTLFDIIIVNARKPSFFSAKNRHFRVYSPKTGRLKWQRVLNLQRGKIYSGGNYDCLKRMTGWQPARVLYFGDHPYADLADLSMYHGWRTCAIIEELEEEIDKANHPDMKLKVNWSNELQKLLNTYQDCGDDPDCRVLLNEWKDELEQLRVEMKNIFNPYFGSVFRSKKNPTFFSRRLFRVADVYTSRVTNFHNYSLGHSFYPRRGVLPHEFKAWFI